MNILSLEAIHKQFADRPLLNGVTLGIDAGERVGVVGVNGSGKTTLLRIVGGAESADSGRVSTTRDLRVAYLPQNPALRSGLFGVVFMGVRVAEIDKDTVTHATGSEAAEPGHDLCNALLVRTDHFMKIFHVKVDG